MKQFIKSVLLLFIVCSAESAFGIILDPMWMFSDEGQLIYTYFRYCDTARTDNYLCQALESDQLPDTGDSYDGSKYINWDYQFSSDTFYIRDEFDSSVIRYSYCRPGFAGFKTAWDYGMTGFPMARYKYLVFAHKGPNANHKVTVKAWWNNGECGSTDYNETIGTFDGSDTWKVDSVVIPDELRNTDDVKRNTSKYYELVFIINNIDPTDTTSGPPGILKIDDMRLEGCNPIDVSPTPQTSPLGGAVTFTVSASRAAAGDVLTYQWKKDGVAIEGATSNEYAIASVTNEDVGEYTVDVTISGNDLTFTSYGAPLTIGTGVVKEYEPPVRIDESSTTEESNGCGCGSGVGLAFIVPIWVKMKKRRKK